MGIGLSLFHLFQEEFFESHRLNLDGFRGKQRPKGSDVVDVPTSQNAYGSSLEADVVDSIDPKSFGGGRIVKDKIYSPKSLLNLVERALKDSAPFLDHDDVIGNLLNLGNLVRREKDRGAIGRLLNQTLKHLLGHDRVEPFTGFVKDQKFRMAAQVQEQSKFGSHPF